MGCVPVMGIYLHQWAVAEPVPRAGCKLRREAPPFEMTAAAGMDSEGLHGDEDGTWVQVTKGRGAARAGSEVKQNDSSFEGENSFGALEGGQEEMEDLREDAIAEAAACRGRLAEAKVEKNVAKRKLARKA